MKIHLQQIKAKQGAHYELTIFLSVKIYKSKGFVDSGFVKTCDELVIG